MERDIQLIVVVIIHFYILLDNQSNPVTFLFISINKNLYITSENVLTIPHLAAFALLLHQKAGPYQCMDCFQLNVVSLMSVN